MNTATQIDWSILRKSALDLGIYNAPANDLQIPGVDVLNSMLEDTKVRGAIPRNVRIKMGKFRLHELGNFLSIIDFSSLCYDTITISADKKVIVCDMPHETAVEALTLLQQLNQEDNEDLAHYNILVRIIETINFQDICKNGKTTFDWISAEKGSSLCRNYIYIQDNNLGNRNMTIYTDENTIENISMPHEDAVNALELIQSTTY